MDGIPRALKSDSEDVAWALETAEALWKRGERVDAVVWVRRAAQAAGEGDDAKRAATLGRYAAELGDWIGSHTMAGESIEPEGPPKNGGLDALDLFLGEAQPPPVREESAAFVLSTNDVELVSAREFEAGFPIPSKSAHPPAPESEVMTVSLHAPDVEILEEVAALDDPMAESIDFDDEPAPAAVRSRSPVPKAPSAAQAHAGILDPWSEAEAKRKAAEPAAPRESRARPPSRPTFDEDEVITSARNPIPKAPSPVPVDAAPEAIPAAPKAPRFQVPRPRPVVPTPAPQAPAGASAEASEDETTTYRQVVPRAARPDAPISKAPAKGPLARPAPSAPVSPAAPAPPRAAAPVAPVASPPRAGAPVAPRPAAPKVPDRPAPQKPPEKPIAKPAPKPRAPEPPPPAPPPPAAKERSVPPALDLLEMVDSVSFLDDKPASVVPAPAPTPTPSPPTAPAPPSPSPPPSALPSVPAPSDQPTSPPGSTPVSGRPTAPPSASSLPVAAMPSIVPTRPRAGMTLLDLGAVEALADLPDDAREAFALAATMHTIARDEEVSHFALALVVAGEIDVSATIVDAPALRLERNAILRSRGSIVPGVGLRLVCASETAQIATWDDAAVEAAFRTCPWVEEDLRAVADGVQAKAGVTMGPLGERFDQSLREHFTSKLTVRNLSPGEVLVVQGKPTPIAVVGIGELLVTKDGARVETLRPGDFVFPSQILAHAPATATATAGPAGAVVLYGDRAVAQELLMGFPPLLEVLATI